MLVLTRKTQERIVISDDIVVTVVRINGNQVRIGIEAPPHISVRRAELARKDFETPCERTAPKAPTSEGESPLSRWIVESREAVAADATMSC